MLGVAASTAQLLPTAGARGKRHALPNSRIVLRHPTAGSGAADIATRAGVSGQLRRRLAELTARYTDRSVETGIADSDRERWFVPAEARGYGLVDHVG